MSDLRLDVIHLVPDLDHAVEEEEKVSSSSARIRSLGTLLKSPKVEAFYRQSVSCDETCVCTHIQTHTTRIELEL